MTDVGAELRDLLAEKPALESDLETVLEIDAEGSWEFDDIPLDSGAFGEIVSRGIVESTDDGYRIADRAAVRAVLENDAVESDQTDATATSLDSSDASSILNASDISRSHVAPLALGLLILLIARVYMYPSVFRPEAITLLGNDPYYYRYLILELARTNAGLFAVPGAIEVGEPLLIATLWTVTALLGGAASTGFAVLAWYPVVAALLSGGFIYGLTVTLTRDRRVGLAALVMLAVTPVLGYRTALGFADHHAFDFIWLSLTMAAVVWLARHDDVRSGGSALAIVGLAIGVSAQVLAWNAGALLLVPIALYGVLHAYTAIRDGHSPVTALGPVALGVGLGAAGAWAGHLWLGWQSRYMVLTPTLLAVGLVALIAGGVLARRIGIAPPTAGAALVGIGVVLIGVTVVVFPDFTAEAVAELTQLVGKTGQQQIAEVKSIFSTDYGLIVGPFFFFGLSFFFAIPYLLWGTWRGYRRYWPAWIAAGSYGFVFLVLGIIRVRFAGQLALIAAVYSGLAFVHLVAVVQESGRPAVLDGTIPSRVRDITLQVPDRQTVVAIVGVFLLIGGLGTMMAPLRVNILTYSDAQYDAAMYMDEYAAQQNWSYPQSYVFSRWGDNRMYNALVSGESASYGYARGNYEQFLASTNGSRWYQRLRDRGFIVTTDLRQESWVTQSMLYAKLHRNWGIGTDHFRPLYAAGNGSVKVFAPVQGAIIAGHGGPNASVVVTGELDVTGASPSIQHSVSTRSNGWFAFKIPAPGRFQTPNSTVTVSASEVRSGAFANKVRSNGYWPLSAGSGSIAFDIRGGHHARIVGAHWTDRGLVFNGQGYVTVSQSQSLGVSDGFSVSTRFKTRETIDYRETLRYPRIVSAAPSSAYRNTRGYQIVMARGRIMGVVGNGQHTARVIGPYIDDGQYHTVTLSWTGKTLRLVVDGTVVDTAKYNGPIDTSYPLVFGASATHGNRFKGTITWVRFNRSS